MRERCGPSARRGVSEILATVLIVAIIVVAFVMTSGLWFGTLGSQSGKNIVKVDQANVPASIGRGASYVDCQSGLGASDVAYVHLYNQGTAAVEATAISFQYGGTTFPITPNGTCSIAPQSGLYLVIVSLPFQMSPGDGYRGYVSMASGARASFAGAFN